MGANTGWLGRCPWDFGEDCACQGCVLLGHDPLHVDECVVNLRLAEGVRGWDGEGQEECCEGEGGGMFGEELGCKARLGLDARNWGGRQIHLEHCQGGFSARASEGRAARTFSGEQTPLSTFGAAVAAAGVYVLKGGGDDLVSGACAGDISAKNVCCWLSCKNTRLIRHESLS